MYVCVSKESPCTTHTCTVPVNKKLTFRFKKTIVLRSTVLSKNGTCTTNEMEGTKKQNGTYYGPYYGPFTHEV